MFRRRLIEIPLFFLFLFSTAWLLIYSVNPDPTDLKKCLTTEMNQVYLCKGSEDYISLTNINRIFMNAVIVSEDANFFKHSGFDFKELYNSFILNLKKGEFVRGGSTITQQLVKNVFLSGEKSLIRKLREAQLAYQIEGIFSKNSIFEKYLNVIEFGPEIYGIKSASWYYFNKIPHSLTPLQSVYLAQLLPNPIKFSKTFRNKKLDKRTTKTILLILKRMHLHKKISTVEYKSSLKGLGQFPW